MPPRKTPGEGGRPHASSPWIVQAFHLNEHEYIIGELPPGLKSAGYTTTRDMTASVVAERFLATDPDPGDYVLVAGPGPVGNVTVVKVRVYEQPSLVLEVI